MSVLKNRHDSKIRYEQKFIHYLTQKANRTKKIWMIIFIYNLQLANNFVNKEIQTNNKKIHANTTWSNNKVKVL